MCGFFRMTTNEGVIDVEDQNDDGVEAPDKMRSIVTNWSIVFTV